MAGSRRDVADRFAMAQNVSQRSGWVTFAAVAAFIAGGYNTLRGIAAFSDADTLAAQAQEVLYVLLTRIEEFAT